MNFLAHAYLSFDDTDLIVGNLIADMVKGRQIEKLPFEIQQGIWLHRQIDTFTDRHPVVKEAKKCFDETAGRYNGSFLDVAYDHFLGKSEKYEPQGGWEEFAQRCYKAIESRASVLPSPFISMFLYMKSENWLLNYKDKWLIERSFERLQNRAEYIQKEIPVYQDFEKHYDLISDSFDQFFPDLVDFVKNREAE